MKPVTIEQLKAGATVLGISFDPRATVTQLEYAITKHLKEDDTYGEYGCPSCERKITDIVPICPYCTVQLAPLPQYEDPDFATIETIEDENFGEIEIQSLAVHDAQATRPEDIEAVVTKRINNKKTKQKIVAAEREQDAIKILSMLPIKRSALEQIKREKLLRIAAVIEAQKGFFQLKTPELIDLILHTQAKRGFDVTEDLATKENP